MVIPCQAAKVRGRSNDYGFVTQYNAYWYGIGSAHQLFHILQQLKI